MEISSVLEGESVEFVWNEEEETHDVVLPDSSALEDEDLEGLIEDMDFRGLLPDGEVDEGDEWEIDLLVMLSLFSPGGDTKLIPETNEEMEDMGMGGDTGDATDYFNEDIEGEFTAVFDGDRKSVV